MHRRSKSSFSQLPSLRTVKEIHMSYLPSILRSAALAAATFVLTPTSFVTGTATVMTVTVMTTSQAEAGRPRVQDHRKRTCPPHARGPGCTPR
jgi:hypothetical protein